MKELSEFIILLLDCHRRLYIRGYRREATRIVFWLGFFAFRPATELRPPVTEIPWK